MTDNPTPRTVAPVASALAVAILRESLAAGRRIKTLVGAGDGEKVVDRDRHPLTGEKIEELP